MKQILHPAALIENKFVNALPELLQKLSSSVPDIVALYIHLVRAERDCGDAQRVEKCHHAVRAGVARIVGKHVKQAYARNLLWLDQCGFCIPAVDVDNVQARTWVQQHRRHG